MRTVLEVKDLNVWLGLGDKEVHITRGVSFDLQAGMTLSIVGESGSGKSITAMSLMGLLPAQSQFSATAMSFEGRELRSYSDDAMAGLRGNRMAMIFQDPMTSLNPYYTIGNQLEEVWLRHRKGPRSVARDRAAFLLERVRVPNAAARLRQYPHQLSGGLRQRVMIAMALMCEPAIVIADEPTTALDVNVQAEVLELLAELQNELGLAILLITHDLGVVAKLAQQVAVMYAGRFVETGPTSHILEAPQHPYTRALINAVPSIAARDSAARLKTIPGAAPSMTGPEIGCAFASRCEDARQSCLENIPLMIEIAPGRQHRCPIQLLEGAGAQLNGVVA